VDDRLPGDVERPDLLHADSWEMFFHHAPVGLALFDREKHYVKLNALMAQIGNADKRTHIGRTPAEIDPTIGKSLEAALDYVIASGCAIDNVEIAATRDGEERHWRCGCRPVKDSTGALLYIACSAQDITDLKEAEKETHIAQRKAAQEQKDEALIRLSSGIVHDFNNVLAVLESNLDFLKESYAKDDQCAELIGYMEEACAQAADILHRLLVAAQKQPLKPQRLDVERFLAGLRPAFEKSLGPSTRLSVQLGRPVWPIIADPGALESALIRIAGNARDAMPNGGEVAINIANAACNDIAPACGDEVEFGDYVAVTIADTGPGMAPDVYARAFDPFFTTKSGGRGTGLGLSMVRGFARQSRGYVKIETDAGHGTTVTLFLPRDPESAEAG
jgi:PAS domain S-box-containing protein